MAIKINQAWKINADGSQMQAITEINNNDFSSLAENEQNKVYNSTRMLMAYGYYNNSGAIPSVSEIAQICVDRSKPMPDFSYCFAGLGNESVLSNIEYINFAPNLDGTFGKTYKDNNFNTPWCINAINKRGGTTPDGRIFGDTYPNNWNKDDDRTYSYCWKNSYNTNDPNDLAQYWNNSAYISANTEQIQNIALKNFILCIIVVAKRIYESTNVADVRIFDLYTYKNTEHTNYPYVVGVYAVPFIKTNDTIGKRKPFVNTDSPIAPTVSLTLFKELAISGNISYQISENEKYYYNDSMWREGLLNTAYFTGTNSIPPSFQYMAYSGDSAESTGCNISSVIPIMGVQFSQNSNEIYCVGVFNSNTNPSIILKFVPETWNYYKWKNNSKWYHVWYRTYDETFYEECLKQVACFGLFFTDRLSVAISGECDNIKMYLGILDSQNIGHGMYTSGQDNKKQKQWNWTDSSDADYDPNYNPVPEFPEDYSGVVTKVPKEGIARGGKWYILNGKDYETHFNEFLNDVSTSQAEIYQLEPIQCVISSKVVMCPDFFGIPKSVDTGRIILGTHGFPESGTYPSVYAFADCYPDTYVSETKRVLELYHDFRDYEPYTKVSIYLPFAGNIEIPTNMVMNRHVHYEETIDPISGDLRYVIYIDGVPFTSVTGNCSFDLDINGEQSSLYRQSQLTLQHQRQDNQYNTLKSIAGNVIGASIAAKLKNPLGSKAQYVSGGISFAQGYFTDKYIEAQLDHSQPQPIQIAKTTSNCEYGDIILPCIAITRPRMVDGYTDDYFRKTNGFKTFTYSTVGQQKFFVQCSNVHMSGVNCTMEESAMIKKLLESGIYIKE